RTNSGVMPACFTAASITGPPPWTMIGRMPTHFRRATSWANESFRSSFSIACPPYLMTSTLPAKRWMYGSASMRTSAFSTGVTRALCRLGSSGSTFVGASALEGAAAGCYGEGRGRERREARDLDGDGSGLPHGVPVVRGAARPVAPPGDRDVSPLGRGDV